MVKKKRDIRSKYYLTIYLLTYILGSFILVFSYINDNEGFFLLGLAIVAISIFLHFLYLAMHVKIRKIKVVKVKKEKKVKKPLKFKFPRVKLPKFKFPGFKFPKVKLPKPKLKPKPKHKPKLPKFKFPSIKLSKVLPKIKFKLPKVKGKEPLPKIEGKKFKLPAKRYGRITETDFDRLVDIVNKVGVMKISTVAKIFHITNKKAEEWGKILEDHNLLKLHYPPIGEPELRKWKK